MITPERIAELREIATRLLSGAPHSDDDEMTRKVIRALPDLLDAVDEAERSSFASTRCECPHCKCGAHRKEARAFLAEVKP